MAHDMNRRLQPVKNHYPEHKHMCVRENIKMKSYTAIICDNIPQRIRIK